MKTQSPFNLGNLTGLKLDDANYYLRMGRATREDAEQYVAMWNQPGHRLTRATLDDHLVNVDGIALMAPFIRIS